METVRIERLDHLGVIASVINALGLVRLIDARLPPDGFRELFVQNFCSGALAPKIIPAFSSSPDVCFVIKRS